MSSPKGWQLFHAFEEEIKSKNRFFPSDNVLKMFDVIIKSKYHRKTIPQGTFLYRGRRNHLEGEFELVSDLGINKNAPSHNRASPMGIPYMYLADDPETAIAELRANVNDYVTVATFETAKPLQFLRLDQTSIIDGDETGDFDGLEVVSFISYLSYAFAAPVQKRAEMEYLPTQYFSEYCKHKGLAGIQYVSSARGFLPYEEKDTHFNYVLFDADGVSFREAYRYKVERIHYDIKKESIVFLKDEGEK